MLFLCSHNELVTIGLYWIVGVPLKVCGEGATSAMVSLCLTVSPKGENEAREIILDHARCCLQLLEAIVCMFQLEN